MTLIANTYCTEAEIVRFIGQVGVDEAADNDGDNTADTDVVDDCINQASQEIELYSRQKYTPAQLATSTLVNRWCVVIATRFLFMRRGNDIPATVEIEWERIANPGSGLLMQLQTGRIQLPGVAKRADLRPTMSNLRIDRRRRTSTVRVTRPNSSDAPSDMSQDFDDGPGVPTY